MECPEQAVPDEPELPEVHLRFLEAFSVMPAVKFCAAQDALERAQPVVQVGVLEGQVYGQNGEPAAYDDGRSAQQAEHRQTWRGHDGGVQGVTALAVEPVEAV